MKFWIVFIVSFALMFAGFANAVEAAMPCHSEMKQHVADSVSADVQESYPACAHQDNQSDHGKPGKNEIYS